MDRLKIEKFAQINSVDIAFGDLTVLVGPQATGKSLVLQWLKLALDGAYILASAKQVGQIPRASSELLNLVFGDGMAGAWKPESRVFYRNKALSLESMLHTHAKADGDGQVFYVPAHRASLISEEGWPMRLERTGEDTPMAARLFGDFLYKTVSIREKLTLFPVERQFKKPYRKLIDAAIYHKGEVKVEKTGTGSRMKLRIAYGGVDVPFMTWTAGQREFTPLLIGLGALLPGAAKAKLEGVKYVIIEEPEMGLHPQAISAFMALVLELLDRPYKVVISTHSPLVLEVIWAIQHISKNDKKDGWQKLAKSFGISSVGNVKSVMKNALEKIEYKVYALEFDKKNNVGSEDISSLSQYSQNPLEAGWGGLTGFSSKFGGAVRDAVNGANP